MRPSRRRFYGHPSLVSHLTELAARTQNDARKLLLIGDLGLPRGGPMLMGHASHQNGLDADIWFMTRATRPTDVERERLSAPGFVSGRKRLRSTWGAAQARLLAAAADNADINRIFVSPPIKRYMCRNFSTAPWLYRLRPWWGHEDHFHVRLKCPARPPTLQGTRRARSCRQRMRRRSRLVVFEGGGSRMGQACCFDRTTAVSRTPCRVRRCSDRRFLSAPFWAPTPRRRDPST